MASRVTARSRGSALGVYGLNVVLSSVWSVHLEALAAVHVTLRTAPCLRLVWKCCLLEWKRNWQNASSAG